MKLSLRQTLLVALIMSVAAAFSPRIFVQRSPSRSFCRSFSPSALLATPKAEAELAIQENNVMVFSKTYCPYCEKAKSALNGLDVKYGLIELDVS